MPRFRIHRLVDLEFWEALDWYASLSPLAADNFAFCFDAALETIKRRPTSHAPWRTSVRRIRLRPFPYLLIFHAGQRVTSVLALVHERREPGRVFVDLARRRQDFL